tara:strand:+ start:59 stop:1030 length:972 start_codon:yes stop_codon:yes gene_type:complete
MADDKNKFVADDGYSEVPQPVKPEGGENVKKKKGEVEVKKSDVKTPGQEKAGEKVPTAEEVETTESEEVVEEVVEVESTIDSIFEGTELSDEFKSNIKLVFEAAVNEEVATKTESLKEELEGKLETELSEAIDNRMKDVVENVDKYLDYVVGEWMEENKIAVEAGIKVEMAESLLGGLKDLFNEHNIEIDEDTFDVVESLEKQVAELETGSNDVVNENITLKATIASMNAEKVFEGMTEGLSDNQVERFKVLSEKLDVEDIEDYTSNLSVIKESFFSEGKIAAPKVEDVEEDEIILEEQEVTKPASDYDSINALVESFNAKTK